MSNIELSIIIVNYNTKNFTLAAVKSIVDSKPKTKYEIIIINNGSSEIIKTRKAKVVLNKNNVGFTKANNQGIRLAKGGYILLLNSDTEVTKGAIDLLVEFAKSRPDAGVVAPKLLNPDGSVQPSIFRFPTIIRAARQYWVGKKGILDKFAPTTKRPKIVEVAVMAAFLITPKAVKKVGTLDERYFMYFEDFDYCRRIELSSLKVYYLPAAKVYHYHGASGMKLADEANQWRRLIPSSKIYHGLLGHHFFNFFIWSSQKFTKYLR